MAWTAQSSCWWWDCYHLCGFHFVFAWKQQRWHWWSEFFGFEEFPGHLAAVWTNAEDHQHPITAVVDATIFVIWNKEGNKQHEQLPLQSYDVSDDEWSVCGDLPNGVKNTEGASAVGTSKHLYLLGGGGHLALRYCPGEDQWTKLSRPVTLHIHGSAAVVDDTIDRTVWWTPGSHASVRCCGKLQCLAGHVGSENQKVAIPFLASFYLLSLNLNWCTMVYC